MSKRGYKIEEIKTKNSFSFNCSEDAWLYKLSKSNKRSKIMEFDKKTIKEKTKNTKVNMLSGYRFIDINNWDKLYKGEYKTNKYLLVKIEKVLETLNKILKDMGKEDYILYKIY